MLIEQIATRPTAEINGIIGGYTGRGRQDRHPRPGDGEGVVPPGRRAGPGEDPRRPSAPSCARGCRPTPRSSSRASPARPRSQLPFDNPALAKTRAALAAEWGKKAIAIGEGGSIPIVGDFKRVLGMDTIMVGFALDDDRVHSPNEKYDLTSFHKGTRSWARILAALAG